MALNAQPSQFQLHLHCILPPLLPQDFHLLLLGKRFTRGRWLPLEYVTAALRALINSNNDDDDDDDDDDDSAAGILDAPERETKELLGALAALPGGPRYDDYFDAALERYRASHEALANWDPRGFAGVAVVHADGSAAASNRIHELASPATATTTATTTSVANRTEKELNKADKKLLSCYGAPDGPRSFYAFAKGPGEVITASEWAGRVSSGGAQSSQSQSPTTTKRPVVACQQ